MKNTNEITKLIAKQTKLVEVLKVIQKESYDNRQDDMITTQAEYFIAAEVLRALRNVLPQITDHQENLDYYNN
tara:strand:+ start:2724 stop:2942 length:219 start_codon:yes stop_codon:yes gene_type:complete